MTIKILLADIEQIAEVSGITWTTNVHKGVTISDLDSLAQVIEVVASLASAYAYAERDQGDVTSEELLDSVLNLSESIVLLKDIPGEYSVQLPKLRVVVEKESSTIQAVKITPEGFATTVELDREDSGMLAAMYAEIGCRAVEHVDLGDNLSILFDEEGGPFLKPGAQFNALASLFADSRVQGFPLQIHGAVLLVTKEDERFVSLSARHSKELEAWLDSKGNRRSSTK